MNKNLLHIFFYITIIIVYTISIIFYGVKNINTYNIILFLFASPLVEEYIFRGLVQKNIQKKLNYTFFSYIQKRGKVKPYPKIIYLTIL